MWYILLLLWAYAAVATSFYVFNDSLYIRKQQVKNFKPFNADIEFIYDDDFLDTKEVLALGCAMLIAWPLMWAIVFFDVEI